MRRYSITPSIRLWGMGGLTTWGFALPPRKTIVVSAAGPLLGVAIGLAAMQVEPRMQAGSTAEWTVHMVVLINLYWGLLNLLPIAADLVLHRHDDTARILCDGARLGAVVAEAAAAQV